MQHPGAYRFGIDQGVTLELGGGSPSGLRSGDDGVGSEKNFHVFYNRHDGSQHEVSGMVSRSLFFRDISAFFGLENPHLVSFCQNGDILGLVE